MERRDNLEDVCSNKGIILKWFLKKQDMRKCNNLCGSGYGPVSGSGERCNNYLDLIKLVKPYTIFKSTRF